MRKNIFSRSDKRASEAPAHVGGVENVFLLRLRPPQAPTTGFVFQSAQNGIFKKSNFHKVGGLGQGGSPSEPPTSQPQNNQNLEFFWGVCGFLRALSARYRFSDLAAEGGLKNFFTLPARSCLPPSPWQTPCWLACAHILLSKTVFDSIHCYPDKQSLMNSRKRPLTSGFPCPVRHR